ncbi:hypothetical protein [Actinophytocola sp.]|uniref:hypothetical protein n=1 Tax=Actinophytocola sp. TaxID=1872138 RepID=UPI002D80F4C6|nr:hypothetical protein [Actinophytocola sp.]HET9140952.1 hypothetical protein [Actinophytocola sp.]
MADDQEQLIAEALRAQAAHTPLPPAGRASEGYGLLSGTDLPLGPPAQPATTVRMPSDEIPEPPATRVPVLAILLLAAALGLAAGAVVGLLTLL